MLSYIYLHTTNDVARVVFCLWFIIMAPLALYGLTPSFTSHYSSSYRSWKSNAKFVGALLIKTHGEFHNIHFRLQNQKLMTSSIYYVKSLFNEIAQTV